MGETTQGSERPRESEIIQKYIDYAGKDQVVEWHDYLAEKEKHAGKSIRFTTGFPEMDYEIEGVETGELITISGYTGMGKTLFLKSLIRSFGSEDIPVCVFCYEDRVDNYLRKLKEEEYAKPLYLPMELKLGNMRWIEERVLEAKYKYNTRIVTIDHLHYLMDNESGSGNENMSTKLGTIMRFLKSRIAVQHNVVVVVVAHQGKPKDDVQEATLEGMRDSGLIGNESDKVIVVQRMPDDPKMKGKDATFDQKYALVKIEKDRRTGSYRKRLTFQKRGNWLCPV